MCWLHKKLVKVVVFLWVGKKLGIWRSWHTVTVWTSLTTLKLMQRPVDVPKKAKYPWYFKKRDRKVENQRGNFLFIVLPALAGVCPLWVSQVQTLYHVTPETSANPETEQFSWILASPWPWLPSSRALKHQLTFQQCSRTNFKLGWA